MGHPYFDDTDEDDALPGKIYSSLLYDKQFFEDEIEVLPSFSIVQDIDDTYHRDGIVSVSYDPECRHFNFEGNLPPAKAEKLIAFLKELMK